MFNHYNNHFDCNYVNKPFCDLRPISNCQPNLRFSCPERNCNCWNNNSNCCWQNGFWPSNNFWPNQNCCFQGNNVFPRNWNWNNQRFFPNSQNYCWPQQSFYNPNLFWFLGGYKLGSNCSNNFSGN